MLLKSFWQNIELQTGTCRGLKQGDTARISTRSRLKGLLFCFVLRKALNLLLKSFFFVVVSKPEFNCIQTTMLVEAGSSPFPLRVGHCCCCYTSSGPLYRLPHSQPLPCRTIRNFEVCQRAEQTRSSDHWPDWLACSTYNSFEHLDKHFFLVRFRYAR